MIYKDLNLDPMVFIAFIILYFLLWFIKLLNIFYKPKVKNKHINGNQLKEQDETVKTKDDLEETK